MHIVILSKSYCGVIFKCYFSGSFHRSAKGCSMINPNYRNIISKYGMLLTVLNLAIKNIYPMPSDYVPFGWFDLTKGGTCPEKFVNHWTKNHLWKSLPIHLKYISASWPPHEPTLYVKKNGFEQATDMTGAFISCEHYFKYFSNVLLTFFRAVFPNPDPGVPHHCTF